MWEGCIRNILYYEILHKIEIFVQIISLNSNLNSSFSVVAKLSLDFSFSSSIALHHVRLTLCNVCAVRWGLCSTVADIQYSGGIP